MFLWFVRPCRWETRRNVKVFCNKNCRSLLFKWMDGWCRTFGNWCAVLVYVDAIATILMTFFPNRKWKMALLFSFGVFGLLVRSQDPCFPFSYKNIEERAMKTVCTRRRYIYFLLVTIFSFHQLTLILLYYIKKVLFPGDNFIAHSQNYAAAAAGHDSNTSSTYTNT